MLLKHFYCRQILTPGPCVILNTKIHKRFGSNNGPLTQSVHHRENTKIKLITVTKQRRVLVANPWLILANPLPEDILHLFSPNSKDVFKCT